MPTQPTVEERVARHLAANDYLTPGTTADDEWWDSRIPKFRADYLAYAREVIALVRDGEPAAVLPEPAGRAALERVRAVLETEAVVGRSALEYRGLIVSALMAGETPAATLAPAKQPPMDPVHILGISAEDAGAWQDGGQS